MSRDPKLDLFDKILKQELGLEYKQSGDVQLNFFPDSTNSGVSVPLVLAGNTNNGVCPAINLHPLTGHPFSHIVDSKSYDVGGGNFKNTNVSTASEPGFKLPGGGGTERYFRSRDFNERIVDEIGVSMVEVAGSGNDEGGPGTFLNFPPGIYQLSGSAPAWQVQDHILFWCNFTQAKSQTVANRGQYLEYPLGIRGTLNFINNSGAAQGRSFVEGRFKVTSADDSYLLLHGAAATKDSNVGFGIDGQGNNNFEAPIGNIFAELKIWKIG
jgi:hypothetical protein